MAEGVRTETVPLSFPGLSRGMQGERDRERQLMVLEVISGRESGRLIARPASPTVTSGFPDRCEVRS